MPDPNPKTDPQLAYRRATSIGPDPTVPSRTGLTGLFNWLVSLGIPIYPEQEVTPLDLAAAVPPLKGLKSLAALAKGEKAAEAAADVAKGIRAYHGSPHDFERFDLTKIGTGEGAQAYGHGLYFAEKEGTARAYRDQLSNFGQASAMPEDMTTSVLLDNKVVSGRKPSNELTPLERAALAKHYAGGLQAQAIRETEDTLKYLTPGSPAYIQEQETLAALKQHDLTGRVQPFQGRMYEVNINADPEHFLDWDQPLSAQSERVREAVASAYGDVRPVRRPDGTYSITSVDPDGSGRMLDYGFREPTPEAALAKFREAVVQQPGNLAYRELAAGGNAPKASAALKAAGIPGIRYLDAGSRTAGEGSRNYVLFNDALVDILRKYGWLPPVGGLAALSQFGRPTSEPR